MATDSLADALRECEEAVAEAFCDSTEAGHRNNDASAEEAVKSQRAAFEAIRRYGDLREEAGYERGMKEAGGPDEDEPPCPRHGGANCDC